MWPRKWTLQRDARSFKFQQREDEENFWHSWHSYLFWKIMDMPFCLPLNARLKHSFAMFGVISKTIESCILTADYFVEQNSGLKAHHFDQLHSQLTNNSPWIKINNQYYKKGLTDSHKTFESNKVLKGT